MKLFGYYCDLEAQSRSPKLVWLSKAQRRLLPRKTWKISQMYSPSNSQCCKAQYHQPQGSHIRSCKASPATWTTPKCMKFSYTSFTKHFCFDRDWCFCRCLFSFSEYCPEMNLRGWQDAKLQVLTTSVYSGHLRGYYSDFSANTNH